MRNVTQEDGHTAVCSEGSSVTFANCTIAQNGVPWEHSHGSIFCAGAEVILVNTISFENFIAEVRFNPWGEASRAIISHSNIDGVSTNDNGIVHWLDGNINEDPLFVNSEEGNYNLTEESPCIDAGTAFFVWEDDTVVNMSDDEYNSEAPDMGAFESEFNDITDDSFILHPSSYILHPPHPNPFNSTTTLRFDLPVVGLVKLIVYDLSGREVVTVTDDRLKAGYYRISLNGDNLPSGIYLARFEVAGFTQTAKLMLIR